MYAVLEVTSVTLLPAGVRLLKCLYYASAKRLRLVC